MLTNKSFPIDEKEKDFNIIQVTFSDFVLVLLAEVDAVDPDGLQMKIAAKKTYKKMVDFCRIRNGEDRHWNSWNGWFK